MDEEILQDTASSGGGATTATLADLLQQDASAGADNHTPGDSGAGDEHGDREARDDGRGNVAVAEPGDEPGADGIDDDGQSADALELDESERDYADSVYERYAKHFAKQWKLENALDPSDPGTRNMIREIIQRGENFKELQTQRQADEAERLRAADEAQRAEGKQPQAEAAPVVDTPEQVQQFLRQVDQLSEQRVRPEVAKVFFTDFLGSIWGDKGREIAAQATPQQQKEFTKTMTKFGYLFLNDALPQILNDYVPGLINRSYPDLAPTLQDTVFEQAFELVSRENPEAAQALEDGNLQSLEEVYAANPWLKTVKFDDNKVKNEAERLRVAMRFAAKAQNNAPPSQVVSQAVERGRQQQRRSDAVRSNGKLSPGESRGEFGRTDATDDLIRGMARSGDRDRTLQDQFAPKPSR